jgi:hypothetical protein
MQHVSEISTLILTSDSSRQEQQNFMSFFRNVFSFQYFSPHKLTNCLFTRIFWLFDPMTMTVK